MSKKYCLIEDIVLKRRTFSIFNITLRNILGVKSSKHRSKQVNSISWVSHTLEIRTFFGSNRKSKTVLNKAFFRNIPWSVLSFFLIYIFPCHMRSLHSLKKNLHIHFEIRSAYFFFFFCTLAQKFTDFCVGFPTLCQGPRNLFIYLFSYLSTREKCLSRGFYLTREDWIPVDVFSLYCVLYGGHFSSQILGFGELIRNFIFVSCGFLFPR